MSIDYAIRVRDPFTLEQLRAATERAVVDIAPGVRQAHIVVVPDRASYRKDRGEAARATSLELQRVVGGSAPPLPDTVLMTTDGDAAISVSETDFGAPEDPELGRQFMTDATLDRAASSFLLSIAVAVAAARLTHATIEDSTMTLTGDEWMDPEDVVARLRLEGPPTERLRDVAVDILERVGLAMPVWRDPTFLDPPEE